MALLAEELVEEWINRDAFFTIRGLKSGVEEIDLLAIKNDTGVILARHVEVQVSFRPVTYIAPLTESVQKALQKSNRRSAVTRPTEQIEECVDAWIDKKFYSPFKKEMRNRLWSNLTWQCILVHGVVKSEEELGLINSKGIQLINLQKILSDLIHDRKHNHSTTGADLIELMRYYTE